MDSKKLAFLKNDFVNQLKEIPADTKAVFGKMNLHQMIEHMSWAFQLANGKVKLKNNYSPELVEKMHRFMMSDKPFKDNTPNDRLPDQPAPARTASIGDALSELQNEIDDMIKLYEADEALRIENPFFGMLNYEEQVQLLHKHALHHLRQFGVN